MQKIFIPILLLSFLVLACKKEVTPPEPSVVTPVKQPRTSDQLLKDSIYYYYKLYSLWEKSIPQYDAIEKFTDTISTAQKVLDNLKAKTPYFAGYRGAYDRFSYFTSLDKEAGLNAVLRMDEADGYGLFFSLGATTDKVAYPVLNFVEGGSPASKAGLERSDIVVELNGKDMRIDVTCDQTGCKAANMTQFNGVIDQISAALKLKTMTLKTQKANSESKNYTLSFETYEVDPLTLDTVFEFANKNVGYLVYSSFEQIGRSGVGLKNKTALDNVFQAFANKNIKSLIVDLRYNSGGYVDAGTYLADKIINTAGDKKLMLKYELNTYLSSRFSNSFKDVYFDRKNNLELETVCFIVSERTASAAEMLINVLKPYMNVKIIAETDRTYGKPVGFFEQKVMNKISLWVTSFKLLNANNETDYWLGLNADKKDVEDFIFTNFGDIDENMIAAALSYTGVSTPVRATARNRSLNNTTKRIKSRLMNVNEVEHRGAIK